MYPEGTVSIWHLTSGNIMVLVISLGEKESSYD